MNERPTDPTTYAALADDLLHRIEDADRLPPHLWPRMMDTVGFLKDHAGEDADRVVCSYLHDVLRRGSAVWADAHEQGNLLDQRPPARPRVRCPHDLEPIDAEWGWNYGRAYLHAVCPTHRLAVVEWAHLVDAPPL